MKQGIKINGVLNRSGFDLSVDLDLDLSAPAGITGETGAGKTTVLRIIAGLEPGFFGKLQFGDEIWADTTGKQRLQKPTHLRGVGVVFQDSRLLPGRTVGANLDYAQRRASQSRFAISQEEITDVLSLKMLIGQPIEALSGGERQRVALGRALLTSPRLLLLDEPLSANDNRQRNRIIEWLVLNVKERGVPMIYVSHSKEELKMLTGCVVEMHHGRVKRHGSTAALLGKMPKCSAPIEGRLMEETTVSGFVSSADADSQILTVQVNQGVESSSISTYLVGKKVSVSLFEHDGLSDKSMLNPESTENQS